MTVQQRKLLKGRIILALWQELKRKPTAAEVERYFRAAKILYTVFVPSLYTANQPKPLDPLAPS